MKKIPPKNIPANKKTLAVVEKTKTRKSAAVKRPWRMYGEFLLILALVFVAYGNAVFNDYNIDDGYVVSLDNVNPLTKKGIQGIWEILTSHYNEGEGVTYGYRPMGKVMMAVEYSLWGNNPHASHFVNLLLYALNCFLLLLFIRKIAAFLDYKNEKVIWLAVLFFIIHPIHTEVVCSIKNREEILCFILMLAALFAWFRYLETSKITHVTVFLVLTFFALLSKQTAFNIVSIILLIAFFRALKSAETGMPLGSVIRNMLNKKMVLIVIATLFTTLLVVNVIPSQLPDMTEGLDTLEKNPFLYFPAGHIFPNSMQTVFFYLGKLVFPYPLLYYYGYDMLPDQGWNSFFPYLGIATIVISIIFLVRSFRKRVNLFVAFWVLFFVATIWIFCNTGITQFVSGIIAERLVYQSSAAFCVLLSMGVFFISEKVASRIWKGGGLKLVYALTAVIALFFLVLTISRNTQWKNKSALYTHDIRFLSNSARANYMMAGHLMQKYDHSENAVMRSAEDLQQAKSYFERAIHIYPKFNNAWLGLGKIYASYLNNKDSALICFQNVDRSSKYLYAAALEKTGDLYRDTSASVISLEYYKKAFSVYPNVNLYKKISSLLFASGNFDELLSVSQTAIKNEWIEGYMNTGAVYLNRKDSTRAMAYFQQAVDRGFRNPGLLKDMAAYYKSKGELEKMNKLAVP